MVLEGIRAEGVGVDDLRSRRDVGAVKGRDVVGTFDVPVFGTLPRLQPPRLQKRSHPAVKEKRCRRKSQS